MKGLVVLSLAVFALLPAASGTARPTATPALRVPDTTPFAVRGNSFKSREHVRVVAQVQGRHVKTVRADRDRRLHRALRASRSSGAPATSFGPPAARAATRTCGTCPRAPKTDARPVTGELLRHALTKLAAARERPYVDEDADREAAAGYYADVEPGFEALSALLESTHRHRPRYRPADELYPLVDLQPDGKLRSLYTDEVWEPEELIEEAARIEERRARMASAAAQEEIDPYNCEHVVPQSWFDHDEPMRGDLHHLFTCERKCNSLPREHAVHRLPGLPQGRPRERAARARAPASSRGEGRGPAARATLYFTLRYPGLGRYSEETLELLLGWHEAEPAGRRTSATGTPPSSSARETGTRSSTTRSGRPRSGSPKGCDGGSLAVRLPPSSRSTGRP